MHNSYDNIGVEAAREGPTTPLSPNSRCYQIVPPRSLDYSSRFKSVNVVKQRPEPARSGAPAIAFFDEVIVSNQPDRSCILTVNGGSSSLN